MSAEATYAVEKLEKAFRRLREAANRASDDLERDGVIQRFEFTFELLWKAIKILLEYEGFLCAGPRSCIKEGARRGLVVEGELLLDMLTDRNKTTHIYSEQIAEEIFERIKRLYLPVIEQNLRHFARYLGQEGMVQK